MSTTAPVPWIQLERLRLDAGLSKTACAQKAGMSRNYYSEIECGRRHGGPATLKSIAAVFGMTGSQLEATRRAELEEVA